MASLRLAMKLSLEESLANMPAPKEKKKKKVKQRVETSSEEEGEFCFILPFF